MCLIISSVAQHKLCQRSDSCAESGSRPTRQYFGVLSKSARVASLVIRSPLHKLLAGMKSSLSCHCHISDLCVCKLAEASALQR